MVVKYMHGLHQLLPLLSYNILASNIHGWLRCGLVLYIDDKEKEEEEDPYQFDWL